MAAKTVLNYLERDSEIHKMTGTTKLAFFLLFTFASKTYSKQYKQYPGVVCNHAGKGRAGKTPAWSFPSFYESRCRVPDNLIPS